jgi:hypothetical protein
MELKPGDIFLTRNSGLVAKGINIVQKWWAYDDYSKFTHAGLIKDNKGTTFESTLPGARSFNFEECHKGKHYMIIRHDYMTPKVFEKAFERVKYHSGFAYPIHRLFLHIIPPLAKTFSKNRAVCSELVGQFLYHAEMLHYWRGVNPDKLEEIFVYWRNYQIVYEGIL